MTRSLPRLFTPFLRCVLLFVFVLCSNAPLRALAAQEENDPRAKSFDLPADEAERSLRAFALRTGSDVVFATAAAKRVRTNPVRGTFLPTEALHRMLQDTSLVAIEDPKTGALLISSGASEKRTPQPSPSGNQAQKKKK